MPILELYRDRQSVYGIVAIPDTRIVQRPFAVFITPVINEEIDVDNSLPHIIQPNAGRVGQYLLILPL